MALVDVQLVGNFLRDVPCEDSEEVVVEHPVEPFLPEIIQDTLLVCRLGYHGIDEGQGAVLDVGVLFLQERDGAAHRDLSRNCLVELWAVDDN